MSAPKGMVGRFLVGFQNELNAIWSDVWSVLKKERGTRSLWITRHSLDGALADYTGWHDV